MRGRRCRPRSKEDDVNSVQLIGRLATDIDIKEVSGGSKVCSFLLAVDRNGEEAVLPLLPIASRCGSVARRPSG